MVRASAPRWGWGRFQMIVCGSFLAVGVLALTATSPAQNPAKAPPKADPPKTEPAKPELVKANRVIVAKTPDVAEMTKIIDEKIAEGWKDNKITPSHEVGDLEFLRRASLDVIGRVPTLEEIVAYEKDPPEKRRSLLIERLLDHADYARHWANVWSNWLLTRSGTFGRGTYHEQMDVWLEDQFAQNRTYDKIVHDLITAKGENTKNGAVNFVLAHVGEEIRDAKLVKEEGRFEMVPLTSRIARTFLGIQIQCAQCHDHPFLTNSLKQERFWGMNAFLRQVDRKGTLAMARNQTPGPLELWDNEENNREALGFYEKRNGVKLDEKAVFLPSGPDKKARKLSVDKDTKKDIQGIGRREELADAVIDHEQFPKALVNRYWGAFFGRGFVNPVDDFNDFNKPSNPELLNELAIKFKHYGYDLKSVIRWICNSEAYQLSCVANKTNDKAEHEALFSRMMLKSMSPEQLYESLMVATNKNAVQAKDEKKKDRTTWLDGLISNFGDDEGNEVNFNGTVVQALMMMNGQNINDAITLKEKGTVAIALVTSKTDDDVIHRLFLAAVCRQPTKKEIANIKELFILAEPKNRGKDTREARYHDLFWALLNSNEFLLNH